MGVAAAAASIAVGAAVAGLVRDLALYIRDDVGPGDLQLQQHSRDRWFCLLCGWRLALPCIPFVAAPVAAHIAARLNCH